MPWKQPGGRWLSCAAKQWNADKPSTAATEESRTTYYTEHTDRSLSPPHLSVLLTFRIVACCKDFSPLPCTRGRGVGGEGMPSGEDSPLTPTLSPEYMGEGEFGCGLAALGYPSSKSSRASASI